MSQLTTEQRDLLHLHLVSGLGPKTTQLVLDHFGSATAVLAASVTELQEVPNIGPKSANDIRQSMDLVDPDAEIARMAEKEVHAVFFGQADYPTCLANTDSPPRVLYVRGSLEALDYNRCIGIVGSRSCTAYGRRMAEQLARDFVQADWTVVSGLARGIDAAAHKSVVAADGKTLAVLANGLSSIYPPEHKELAEQIRTYGAVLSEFPMSTEPLRDYFPRRNRIISGLSRGVVIVEASPRSGALITARLANEQGREVFGIPGPVDSAASAGVLDMLRNYGRLVRDARDVLEDLKGIAPMVPKEEIVPPVEEEPPAAPPNLSAEEDPVWTLLAEQPRHLDEMVQQLDISVQQLSGLLMMMEMKGLIRKLPGNRYERC